MASLARRAPWWIASAVALAAIVGLDSATTGGRIVHSVGIAACLAGILAAPLPQALLFAFALALFPGDVSLVAGALLIVRLALHDALALDRSATSLLLVAFALSAIASALFGVLAVEPRPLQWLTWTVTFGAPVVLLGTARPRLAPHDVRALSRFALFCLGVQLPVGLAQLWRHGEFVSGDWFAGTFEDANMVGLWASCAAGAALVRLAVMRPALAGLPSRGRTIVALAACLLLMYFASARIFAGSNFLGAALVAGFLWLAGGSGAPWRVAGKLLLGMSVALALAVYAHTWVDENADAFASEWAGSGKLALFDRVFAGMGGRYDAVLGVGPGMLGSRAANAASADVLFKEVVSSASRLLGPAPEPERWAMNGLWTADLAETIRDRSALISMPFSGWASIRGELGWPAALAMLLFLIALAARLARRATQVPEVFGLAVPAAVLCAGLPVMLIFDNMLEQPHAIAPLVVLVMAARGCSRGASPAA